jgi:hypothetical protein
MLVMTMAGPDYTTLAQDSRTELCLDPAAECFSGASLAVPTVLPMATDMLYTTTTTFEPFMQAEFHSLGSYWTALQSACGANRVLARYPAGPLKALGYVELEICNMLGPGRNARIPGRGERPRLMLLTFVAAAAQVFLGHTWHLLHPPGEMQRAAHVYVNKVCWPGSSLT